MNILLLTQRVPYPPDRGDRIATYHYLRHFLDRGDRVRIGCLSTEGDQKSIDHLRRHVADICAPRIHEKARRIASLRGLVTGRPLTLPYFSHRGLHATVRRWVAAHAPDVVFAYSSSMAQYAMSIESALRVMYFAELDSDKWRQYAARRGPGPGKWIYGREADRLLAYERHVAHTFDASCVVSEVERELFEQQIEGVVPHVIPNGVDVEHFASQGEAQREPHTVVFTGIMDYEPNVDGILWFVRESWPIVRRAFPDARFLVVGNRPIQAIRALDGHDGVTVTGWVESTPPYIDRASVCVAPLRLARGLQNKVLEAMSMGLPVVATTHAAQGLGEVAADTLLVRDDARQLGDEVVRLLGAPALARAIGARAAAFVRANFRWQNTYVKLDQVLATERRQR